jgi:hypothetical protein
LEYVSIPWDNHCQGDLEVYNKWTVNLALWFLHVVGGNSSDVQWRYQPLKEETAPPFPSASKQPLDDKIASDDKSSSDIGASTKGKRRREDLHGQMSTEADNDEITALREPKRNRAYVLRTRLTIPPRPDQ